ncbi:MAG: ribosome maturation factor RimP [Brachymonas sp.]|nr:ribosome maturation factor RimP [Brachymonas sp.]
MALQEVVHQTGQALGLELVELERSAGGLLRVTIDWPWTPGEPGAERAVTIEDCEKVTRQLQYALQVEDIDYQRLEVGSPGIDRLLRNAQDFERFAGELVDITLKQAIGANAGQIAANRKKFRGALEKTEQGWQIVWSDVPPPPPGKRVSRKKQQDVPLQSLAFTLDEVREARLAPVVNFKGRKAASDSEQVASGN